MVFKNLEAAFEEKAWKEASESFFPDQGALAEKEQNVLDCFRSLGCAAYGGEPEGLTAPTKNSDPIEPLFWID
ncbi:MAG: hypothetical protein CMI18_07055 [Opitutaceae bacterium]|nr:hypothetical protein [Opitutaceae bacterium]|tara:strand:+ start:255 stop:473 length:219 start_codon:yes stop_codon:yes gene_type:complete